MYLYNYALVFLLRDALLCMQAQSSRRRDVYPSVRLSVPGDLRKISWKSF